ncbi:hypothetical protein FRC09_003341 [Ceratobasidium sp. 395]|nr:hypothetical protein FRC09_003341 [Ceratobasidium sp. 395]
MSGTDSGYIAARWAAPEFFDGNLKQCTKETDIYALGVTFLETMVGRFPFGGGKPDIRYKGVLSNVLKGKTPERPSKLDMMEKNRADVLWRTMSRCWSHKAAKRPTASEVEQNPANF